MIITSLFLAALTSTATALPVAVAEADALSKRDDGVTVCDSNADCAFTGCWTESNGVVWCGDGVNNFRAIDVVFDTGMDLKKRQAWVRDIPDEQIFGTLQGYPTLVGDAQHHPRLNELVLGLARLSAPHALEMRDMVNWRIEMEVVEGMGQSEYWDGHIKFSPGMVLGDWEYGLGTVAHECGHAVFDKRGYQDALADGLKAAGLDDVAKYGNLNGMLNEPTAGILAGRSTWYSGDNYANPDKESEWWNRLSWARDVGSIWGLTGFYGKYYGMTQAGIDKLGEVTQIGTDSFLRDFKFQYGLNSDPYLLLPADAPL